MGTANDLALLEELGSEWTMDQIVVGGAAERAE